MAAYAGVSMPEVDEMGWPTWLILRRDAFVARMRETPGGQAWLDDAWRLSATEMDVGALRRRFGSRG